jgi:hypothetical protein
MKEKADSGKKSHKKKAKNNQIHKANPPLERGKDLQAGYSWRVSHRFAVPSRGESREQGTGSRE